jgi:hypothetical protein
MSTKEHDEVNDHPTHSPLAEQVFCQCTSVEAAGGGVPATTACLPVHTQSKLVLSASSPYCAALFQQSTPGAVCTLHNPRWEDATVAVAVLWCIFTGAFDTGGLPGGAWLPGDCSLQGSSVGGAWRDRAQAWQELAMRTLVLGDQLDCPAEGRNLHCS